MLAGGSVLEHLQSGRMQFVESQEADLAVAVLGMISGQIRRKLTNSKKAAESFISCSFRFLVKKKISENVLSE